jgi:hypothetical protein
MESDISIILLFSYTILFGICGTYYNLITNDKNINEYDKMYKIIELASSLDKDPYNRKISSKVVKKFCKIAKKYSIELDNITNEQFDFIYKNYTKYLIKKYSKY